MMVKNRRLEAMVKALGKDVKRYQEVIDGLRIDKAWRRCMTILNIKPILRSWNTIYVIIR
jgi:hypothetical protein